MKNKGEIFKYYKTNAVYEAVLKTQSHSFAWVSGNAWALVYADSTATPKALVLAYGSSWDKQDDFIKVLEHVSTISKIPLYFIEFEDDVDEIVGVRIKNSVSKSYYISLEKLKSIFQKLGLPVSTGQCLKSVNAATSSAYHNWQRANLGGIVVTDIDLFRLDNEGKPVEIIELKRSYISLKDWCPFKRDFSNFNLLLAISKLANLKFNIAYNLRETEPVFKDDASNISVFNYGKVNESTRVAELSFSEFVSGNYLFLTTSSKNDHVVKSFLS